MDNSSVVMQLGSLSFPLVLPFLGKKDRKILLIYGCCLSG